MQTFRRTHFELPTLPLGIAAPCQLHPALAAEDLPTVQLPAAAVDPELSIETRKFEVVSPPSRLPAILVESPRRGRALRSAELRNRGELVRHSARVRTVGILLVCALIGTAVGGTVGWLAAGGFRLGSPALPANLLSRAR